MKENDYEIQKNLEKLYRGDHTNFLTINLQTKISNRLPKKTFQIYYPYPDADKVILYRQKLPIIRLFKINSPKELQHSDILGSLFALNIRSEVFGDIVYHENNFYLYLLDDISDYVFQELKQVGSTPIALEEVQNTYLENYQRTYEEIKIIISSLRIDTILARLIGASREQIKTIIKTKQVLINYQLNFKPDYLIKEGDIFSIRGHGKYRFHKIIGTTKKNNLIILLDKYK